MLWFAAGAAVALLLVWLYFRSDRAHKIAVIRARWPELPRECRVEILEVFERIAAAEPTSVKFATMTDEELRARVEDIITYSVRGGGDIGIDLLEYQVIEHAVNGLPAP